MPVQAGGGVVGMRLNPWHSLDGGREAFGSGSQPCDRRLTDKCHILLGDVRVENGAMFSLTSAAFQNREKMPQKYGKKSQNLSPPLAWQGAPDGTQSYALSLVDLHPVARGYVHWLVCDINAKTTSMPEGAATGGLAEGRELVPTGSLPAGWHARVRVHAVLSWGADRAPAIGCDLEAFRREVAKSSLGGATLSGTFTKVG